ncbi:hypothetical protein ACJX0J_031861, partial [Zea mays]
KDTDRAYIQHFEIFRKPHELDWILELASKQKSIMEQMFHNYFLCIKFDWVGHMNVVGVLSYLGLNISCVETSQFVKIWLLPQFVHSAASRCDACFLAILWSLESNQVHERYYLLSLYLASIYVSLLLYYLTSGILCFRTLFVDYVILF